MGIEEEKKAGSFGLRRRSVSGSLSSCGLLATAVHNKDPEWSKSSLLVRACACSRRGPQPWVVAAASSRGHLLICLRALCYDAVSQCVAVVSRPGAVVCVTLLSAGECNDADQHGGGKMIQVCLLLLGFCLWGSDRHIGSSIRPWWVNAKHAKKATNPSGPHCSSLSCNGWGLRFEEEEVVAQADHRGGRSTFRWTLLLPYNFRRNGAIPTHG